MKHIPWRIVRETFPGEFITLEKIRDSHDGVIATLHADSKVNGPLLCAAPELLEALERLEAGVRLWMSRGVTDEDMEIARAAIRKAKGEA